MKLHYLILPLFVLAGCGSQAGTTQEPLTLVAAKKGFQTKVEPTPQDEKRPLKTPPAHLFKGVQYESPIGQMAAYISPDPGAGKKHPAIVWLHGGNSNIIGNVWSPRRQTNEQSASAYRQAGIIMMFPSLRGGHSNPGNREGFLGEVDDVIAAAEFLKQQPYVDPARIYLGGHSTGGTLAMLVAESTDIFRAVFAFGPVNTVAHYNTDYILFDVNDRKEVELRSPGYWLSSIQSPTWVIEGSGGNSSNIDSLQSMAKSSTNPKAHFIEAKNVDHFEVLGPANAVIAKKVAANSGEMELTTEEVNAAFKK